MSTSAAFRFGACLGLALLASNGPPLRAQTNAAGETNWGKWGPNDQLGTLNYITPEVVRHAAGLVKKGKIFNLALPLEPGVPTGGLRYGRIYRYMTFIGDGDGNYEKPGLAEDHLFTHIHGPTHWDGLAHVYGDAKLYNGYDVRTEVMPWGALKNGVDHAADRVVSRGVLVDVARYKGVPRLSSGYAITPEDIEGAARKQNVSFRQGDIILIRTAYTKKWYEEGRLAFQTGGAPGIGWKASQWLKTVRAAAVALDNLHSEVRPPEPGVAEMLGQPGWIMPIHYELIRNQGMMLGDWFSLDELADDCAADGVYEFLLVAAPLRIVNGTGSPVNPLAIK
jgi:kynurenine formamidase